MTFPKDPGTWPIKTFISLTACAVVLVAVAQGHAHEMIRDSWGGLTVYFGMLLGIKSAADIGKQAVGVQTTKITGEPVPLPGDPPVVAEVAS